MKTTKQRRGIRAVVSLISKQLIKGKEVREGKQNDSNNLKVLYFKIKISSKYIILVLKQSI